MEWLLALFAVAIVGALAGVLAGMLGIGGGLIIVPALVWVYSLLGFPAESVMLFALGTSLASIFFTGLSSVRTHNQAGAVRWRLVATMTPALMLGAFAGSHLADALGGVWLMRLFGVFAALIGLQMLLASRNDARADNEVARSLPDIAHVGSAAVIGVASAIFGIGGGSLTVPYLSAAGLRMQQAVATSAACGVPIAVAGAGGYMFAGWAQTGLPAGSAGYVHLPSLAALVVTSMPMARVGAGLAHRLPAVTLRRLFAVILLLVAVDFLVK